MITNTDLLKEARILFLPGGKWQVPAIQSLRNAGAYVICCDSTPDAPGFAVANDFVRWPLQDLAKLVDVGKSSRVNCVMTDQTDFAVSIVAKVALELGCRGLPLAVAHMATNKAAMRTALQATSIRQPRFRVCREIHELLEAVHDFDLPLFIKPVDAQSSRGVAKIVATDSTILAEQLRHATSQSSSGTAIVEEYIAGVECTVEGFVDSDKPQVLAISDKSHYSELPGVARTLTYPANIPESTRLEIIDAHSQIVQCMGINFGITHTEFIVDDQHRPWLVETAARGGGSLISSHIVPAISGFQPVLGLAEQLLGRKVQINRTCELAAELRFLKLESGRQVRDFPNIDALRKRPGVLWIHLDAGAGQLVQSVSDDRTRHGFVIAVGDNRQSAVATAKQVEQELAIRYIDAPAHVVPSPHLSPIPTRTRAHDNRD